MCCCIGASTTEPRDDVSFRFLYEPLFSTPGRGSQTLEQYSTRGGGGELSLYELWLLKLTNLPVHCLMLYLFEIQSALELSVRDQWQVGRRISSLILTGISATHMVLRECVVTTPLDPKSCGNRRFSA